MADTRFTSVFIIHYDAVATKYSFQPSPSFPLCRFTQTPSFKFSTYGLMFDHPGDAAGSKVV